MSNATYASTIINFQPKPGELYFGNAWMPHGFTRNASEENFKFIHFNLGVKDATIIQSQENNGPTIIWRNLLLFENNYLFFKRKAINYF